MKIVKKIVLISVGVIIVLAAFNYRLIIYGVSQAKGQLKIVNNAVPVSKILNDPSYPDSLKQKLRLIQEVKAYAFDSLGINYSENYTTLYDQHGQPLMYVVTASKPFALEPKEWSFPFVGSFSYKGFFNEQMANQLKEKLKKQGLDTNIRTAGGWSTLGWFKDPVLSEMLNRNEGRLAELIIHELTHGTLFVKDSLKFNENLASFIGKKGAIRFLKYKYGSGTQELKKYEEYIEDKERYTKHILRGTHFLDSVYKSMPENWAMERKMTLKNKSIDKIIQSVDTLSLNNKKLYRQFLEKQNINNTFFISYIRYRGYEYLLERELRNKYKGDIKLLLEDYKERYPSMG